MPDGRTKIVDTPLTFIVRGGRIVTNEMANNGCHYVDEALMFLYRPRIMLATGPKIIHYGLTLMLGGSDIVTNIIANKGGQ
jgi:hypothetical protein